MADIASLGFKIDSSGAVKATDNLQDLEQQARRTEQAADDLSKTAKAGTVTVGKFGSSVGTGSNALGGLGRNAGQAGIQIQQMVGQIQGGVSPMVALSQQAADLGFVLGVPLAGVIVSLGAVVAGTLLPSLFQAKREAGEFTEEILKLTGGIDDLTEAQRALAVLDTERQLRAQKTAVEEATQANKDALRELEKFANFSSRNKFYVDPATAKAAEERFDGLRDSVRDTTETMALANAEVAATEEFLDKLKNGSGDAAKSLADMVDKFEKQAATAGMTARQVALYEANLAKAGDTERQAINNAFDIIEAEEAKQRSLKESQQAQAKLQREQVAAAKAAAAEKQRAVDAEVRFEESIQGSIDRMHAQTIGLDQGRAAALLYSAGIEAAKIKNEGLRKSYLDAAAALAQQIGTTNEVVSKLDELRGVYDPVIALQNQYAEEVAKINEANLGHAETTELIAAATEKLKQAKEKLAEQTMLNAETEQSYFGAFSQGLQESLVTAESAYDQIRDVGTRAIDGLSDTLASFIATGKGDFRSFAAAVVQELLKVQIQMMMVKALSSFSYASGGVPGTTSAQGNVFGAGERYAAGGTPPLTAFSGTIINRPTRFAAGGSNNNLMGEAGPEAILPLKRRPNGDLGVQANSVGQAPAPQVQVPVQVINVTERPEDYLGSSAGVKQIVNIMTRNRQVLQQ